MQLLTQPRDLAGQQALFQGTAHHIDQALRCEGLGDEIVRTGAHAFDGQVDVAVAGDHDHGQVRVLLLAQAHEAEAIGLGQAHVGHDDGDVAQRQPRECLFGAAHALDGQVGQLHGLHAAQAHVGVVFDDEDGVGRGRGHGCGVGWVAAEYISANQTNDLIERARTAIIESLDAAKAKFHEQGIEVETKLLEGQVVHREIVKAAEENHADLIIIGSHGRTGFKKLFLGSVAQSLLGESHIPVLIVRE